MKILLYILEFIMDPLVMLHWWLICLSDIIDPVLAKNKELESYMHRSAFDRADERADRLTAMLEDDQEDPEHDITWTYGSSSGAVYEKIV